MKASKEKSREQKEAVLCAICDHLQKHEPCTNAHVREYVWPEILRNPAKFGAPYKHNAQASHAEFGIKAWDRHLKEFASRGAFFMQTMQIGRAEHSNTSRCDVLWRSAQTEVVSRALHVDEHGKSIEIEVFPISSTRSGPPAAVNNDEVTDEELATCASVLQRMRPAQLDDERFAHVASSGKALFKRAILKERMGERDAVEYLKELHNHVGLLKKLEKLQKEIKRAHEERVEAALTCGINQQREQSMLQIATPEVEGAAKQLPSSAGVNSIAAGDDEEEDSARHCGGEEGGKGKEEEGGGGEESSLVGAEPAVVTTVISAVEYQGHGLETREERRLREAARGFDDSAEQSGHDPSRQGGGGAGKAVLRDDGTAEEGEEEEEEEGVKSAESVAAAAAAAASIPRGDFRRHCNVCKKAYRTLHAFYHQLCPPCGEFNAHKRTQTADLTGYVCIVTGGRVRIGYETVLKLLRAGATVLATSRYPHDAALRFARENDFAAWSGRLHVFGPLEMADVPCVEAFCAAVAARWTRVHLLVNNAAQTLTRPAGWAARMAQLEHDAAAKLHAMPEAARRLLAADSLAALHPIPRIPALVPPTVADPQGRDQGGGGEVEGEGADAEAAAAALFDAESHRNETRPADASASSGAGPVATGALGGAGRGNLNGSAELAPFPEHAVTGLPVLDESRQPLDLSRDNSWRRRLGGVSTGELLHTMAANAVAPFVLCSRLLPLLAPPEPGSDRELAEAGGVGRAWGHVINVSALEGKFSVGKKSGGHPHTNMAKAALNMLTCTSAPDYARKRVLMNAVDTGWVTDNAPGGLGPRAKLHSTHVAPPLDEIDGAARVLDPLFLHVNTGWTRHGLFWKNYQVTQW